MTLKEFFQKSVHCGLKHDPRGKRFILKTKNNPYADSQILYGKPNREIRRILVGIDIETAEILMADKLRQKKNLDLVVAHHPEGKALLQLYKVMVVHNKILEKMGIDKDIAKQIMQERIMEVERKLLSANHLRTVDAARLLNIPFMCLHTVADNLVYDFIFKLVKKTRPQKIKDILDLLYEIPEYKYDSRYGAGPRILLGKPKYKTGKVMVEMTGGTEGSKEIFDWLYDAGVRTLICMHLSEEHFKKIKDKNLNIIIAGHISSDTLGLNLLLDEVDPQKRIEVVSCSGFKRISHN